MLILTKANSKTEYIYSEDKDVKCFLRPLTITERAEVRDLVRHKMDGSVELNINKQHVYIVKRCLLGLSGIEGVEFTTDPIGVSSEFLDVLPMKLISEIGNEVYRMSEAQAQEKK
jgi:hypothetical protein